MSYTLFIGNNCHQCEAVLNYIYESGQEVKIINVDDENEKIAPIAVFAFPALFSNEILLRYGSDIIDYFEKQKKASPISNK